MKQLRFDVLFAFLILLLTALVTGCASTSKRIQNNQSLFNTYTPIEQRMIRSGEVAIGFDTDMVKMSLGNPDRERTAESALGKQIVWEYRELAPSLGLGLGGILGTRGSGVGIGTGVGISPGNTNLRKRITFDRSTGLVSFVENFK